MAITAQLVSMLASGVVDSTGAAIASGLVRFYALGTTTPATVYSDSAAATPITQPLTLTAGGTGTAYLTAARRMKVFDATGVTTLIDVNVGTSTGGTDFITSTAFNGGTETTLQTILDAVDDAFGGSAGYWKYKQSSGATERTPLSWMSEVHVSVKDFGAVGDGVADDTTAVQAAITAVGAQSGGIVFFPPGAYLILSALNITVDATRLVGSGESQTRIVSGTINLSPISIAITASTTARLNAGISNLSITSTAISTGTAITVTGGSIIVDSVTCTGSFRKCVLATSATGSGTRSIVINSNLSTPSSDASSVCIDVTLGNAFVSNCVLFGYVAAVRSSATSYGMFVANNRITGTTAGVVYTGQDYFTLTGNYIAGATTAVSVGANVAAFVEAGNFLAGLIADARAAAPVSYSLSADGSVTVLPGQTPATRIVATAAITVTLGDPGASKHGMRHAIMFVNSSGGAVTWTLNANFHISAAFAPTNGNRISGTFEYDAISAHWYEVSRSASVAN